MTEIESNQHDIDSLLRRSMAAPVPRLAADFDERVLRTVRRGSRPLGRYRQAVITAYCVVSVVVCTVLMRGEGLGWGTVVGTTFGPLMLVVATQPWWSKAKAVRERVRIVRS